MKNHELLLMIYLVDLQVCQVLYHIIKQINAELIYAHKVMLWLQFIEFILNFDQLLICFHLARLCFLSMFFF
jgi:hypothetical protein